MSDGKTHYIGDDCPGGHEGQDLDTVLDQRERVFVREVERRAGAKP